MSGNLSVLFSDLPEGPTEDTEGRFLTMRLVVASRRLEGCRRKDQDECGGRF